MDTGGDGRGPLTTADPCCASCGTQLGATAKFCSECGVPVAPARSAEYKQVTVLFADVVRSMDIAAVVGAERLREIMAELVDRSAAVVKRLGGTLDKFTGDGIMAVFGAPMALEDHAVRACLAALDIQHECAALGVEVRDRDGVDLALRVGLNSGQVIAGEVGSQSIGYTTVGEQVGMAQRMESAAPPGGVLLSTSTARLVKDIATLSKPENVRIKGTTSRVVASRLLAISAHEWPIGGSNVAFVGRSNELSLLTTLLERTIGSSGCVACVVGPPGIGKTRLVREATAIASTVRVDVFTAFCESHARDVPFRVVAQLLRASLGISGVDDARARAGVRSSVPSDATDDDLALLYDLLGIRESDVPLPKIDPDATRRRLSALINSLSLARTKPAVYVIEDAHWIDTASESLLKAFLHGIPRTSSMALITYRPEYRGALTKVPGAETISLAPLTDPSIDALLTELLGADPSVAGVRTLIAERAAGNPFFVEEIVRDLVERRLIVGQPGARLLSGDVVEIEVPATLQATIAARIDRLRPTAKWTLNAAAVVGSRFDADLVSALTHDADVAPLIEAELVEVWNVPGSEYAFRHPLVRTVAYQSQLKSDRARLHRRVAELIENRDPSSADANAALIAEHVQLAGDLHAAYAWHMRAGAWSAGRDIRAARLSWDRARRVADVLPDEDPNRTTMGIAPRTLLCGTAWRVNENISAAFDELRQLSEQTGDKTSLVLGMVGLAMDHIVHARVQEASRLASEYMALAESIGDWALTVRVTPGALYTKFETGELAEGLRWAQRTIDLVEGDTTGAAVNMGSQLAAALVSRGVGRLALGLAEWREDLERAAEVARGTDPMSYAAVVDFAYGPAITCGALPPDDDAIREISEALTIAEQAGDDIALGSARFALGVALLYRGEPDAERGLQLLVQVREMCLQQRFLPTVAPQVDAYIARQMANHGECDAVLPRLRAAADELFERGHPSCGLATEALVEVLLIRGAAADISEAQAAIDRFVDSSIGGLVTSEILLLRLRSLMAKARGDDIAYTAYRDRYQELTTSLGFEAA